MSEPPTVVSGLILISQSLNTKSSINDIQPSATSDGSDFRRKFRKNFVFISLLSLLLFFIFLISMEKSMKRILIFVTILISLTAFALIIFYSYSNTTASEDYPYEGDEPDLPAFLKNTSKKESFLMLRAEAIGLKRGIDKNKPLPDLTFRQTAIAQNGSSARGVGKYARIK